MGYRPHPQNPRPQTTLSRVEPPIPQVDAYRPDNLKGRSAIDALACSDSTLAVGISDSTTAQVLDLKSHAFAAVPLPSGFEAGSVAIQASGNLAFGIRSYGASSASTANRVIQMDAGGKIVAQTRPRTLTAKPAEQTKSPSQQARAVQASRPQNRQQPAPAAPVKQEEASLAEARKGE